MSAVARQGSSEGSVTTGAIEATGLSKSYGGTKALDSVDLRAAPGTVLGLLGPNGAGKTTLIRILATILAADNGSFVVAGVPDSRPRDIRRHIGVLPESAGYPRNRTCEEWLTFHARLFGLSRDDARTTTSRLLDEVGLSQRRRSLIGGLSRGMRQRLGIARALVNDPAVIFLDEPTLGLDPLGQRQVLDLVTGVVRDRGVTVVLSTHVLAEVEQICDRVVIVNRGKVVADGTMSEVVRQAAAPRRARLQVPPHLRSRALHALGEQQVPAAAEDGRHDEVLLLLPGDEPPETSSATALRCLLDDGVPILGFSLEGGRLSDAFLAVTQRGDDD